MRAITVSSCNLNQWSLDFVGNRDRIIEAVKKAKQDGARLIITPELSICGYDCLDAFLELDTTMHSWEVLAELLTKCRDILVDVGMPVLHRTVLYNCRVLFYNGKILFIRPKMSLANDGLFRVHVPLGNFVLESRDGVTIACEMKLNRRLELIIESSKRSGSLYLYANQQGCDGAGRSYYDGCSLIVMNGDVVAQGTQFSLNDLEVITATVNLDRTWLAHFQPARRLQAATEPAFEEIKLDQILGFGESSIPFVISPSFPPMTLQPEEEIALATGLDSCSTALCVYSAARLISENIAAGNKQVLRDLQTVTGKPETWQPKDANEVTGEILHTCFMGSTNSGKETRQRAQVLSKTIGSYHLNIEIDTIVSAFTNLFSATFLGKRLRFKSEGGSDQENLALQNIQSRSRMVLAYLFAGTFTLVRGRAGNLLVLGSANVDEALRGYYTSKITFKLSFLVISDPEEYDNSSADINPIGGISKGDLRKFLQWARDEWDLLILDGFLNAAPTAELVPSNEDYSQTDEDDMGCTYETLTPSLHAEAYNCDSNRHDLVPFLRPPLTWAYNKIEAMLATMEEAEAHGTDTSTLDIYGTGMR
ncbi:MAG: hypothetical protein LQ348_000309 [Seirophora lacunosa]|nr:MAG: hypothetical protein LQ348_000309 [Seirophora lacunosa]